MLHAISAVFSVTVIFVATSELVAQQKYAVVVTVGTYDTSSFSNLEFAKEDGIGLSKSLTALGFKTTLMASDAASSKLVPTTPAKIASVMKAVSASCQPGDSLIVCLSGHGVQFSDEEMLSTDVRETYFCPQDADLTRKSSLLKITSVVDFMNSTGASQKLLLVDACREQILSQEGKKKSARRIALGSVHESRRSIPAGMSVLFSCSSNQFSWEHKPITHSVFTHQVIQFLSGQADRSSYAKDEVTLLGLCKYVSRETNDYVIGKRLSADGQLPVLRGKATDWRLGFVSKPLPIQDKQNAVMKPDRNGNLGAGIVQEADTGINSYQLNLAGLSSGVKPQGWTGSPVIAVDYSDGIAGLKIANDSNLPGPYYAAFDDLDIEGDFYLEAEIVATTLDHPQLLLKGKSRGTDFLLDIKAGNSWFVELAQTIKGSFPYEYKYLNHFYLERKGKTYRLIVNNNDQQPVVLQGPKTSGFSGVAFNFGQRTKAIDLRNLRVGTPANAPTQRVSKTYAFDFSNGEPPTDWQRIGVLAQDGRQRLLSPHLEIGSDFVLRSKMRWTAFGSINITLIGKNGPSLPIRVTGGNRIETAMAYASQQRNYSYKKDYEVHLEKKGRLIRLYFPTSLRKCLRWTAISFAISSRCKSTSIRLTL